MKILFVINGLGTGGAERSLAEMLPLFREAGVDPVVACLKRRPEGIQESALQGGFDVRFVPEERWIPRVRGLRRLMNETRPTIVHTTIFDADVAARLASVRARPILTSLVNTSYDPVRLADPAISRWKLAAARSLDGWTARHLTNHFHAVSNTVKRSAVRSLHIEADRISVVERGRDPTRLGAPSAERRARARSSLGLPQGLVLVTAGRHEFQKGQWHLLEAMPKIVASYPATLLVAGREGNATPRLQRSLRSLPEAQRGVLLGHRDDLPELLAAADLFVLPSLYEGLPGVVIEAMALGLPIVASDLPAVREVVELDRNAVLVDAGSPNSLARAIKDLAADPARRSTMGRRSRQIFEERFTLERSASRMLELFERVAAEGRRAAG